MGISSEDGYKVQLHEHMVRKFTKIFEGLDHSVEELRDPMGGFVFILHGIGSNCLRGLSDLLYTGKCRVTAGKGSLDLGSLLASDFQGLAEDEDWGDEHTETEKDLTVDGLMSDIADSDKNIIAYILSLDSEEEQEVINQEVVKQEMPK